MTGIADLIQRVPAAEELGITRRPYFNSMVTFKGEFTAKQRWDLLLNQAGLNVFHYPAEAVSGCDLLSDSGTTTMINRQWAAMFYGDEAYGWNRGYELLMQTVQSVFGAEFADVSRVQFPNAHLFHQGRPAEHALATTLARHLRERGMERIIIPSNGHFDTTEANFDNNQIEARNLFSPELQSPKSQSHFKGNMDVDQLAQLLEKEGRAVPLVYLTITNNTGGGQPVAMANIKQVSELARAHKIPFFLDACRFAENAWFIQHHEEGYQLKPITEIVREMFSHADGFTISFKKDGLANMGGGLFVRAEGLFDQKYRQVLGAIMDHQILTEGNPSYGGMSGRDLMTLVEGLKMVTDSRYLDHRIKQVERFGQKLIELQVPIVTPIGGHAVYIDVNRFFADTNMKPEDYGGIALTAFCLGQYGDRLCELGNFAFGKFKDGVFIAPQVNYVRAAVPRLRYEDQDLEATALGLGMIHNYRDQVPGVEVISAQGSALPHFKAHFKFKEK